MKKLIVALLLATTMIGCTSKTEHGPCVGLLDEKDSSKVYQVDKGNVIVAFIFAESFFIPAYVALFETYCPISNK